MVAVKHYDVRISSSDDDIMLERTVPDNAITVTFDYMADHSIITLKINITVVDINGQRSESSVTVRNISDMSNIIYSKYLCMHIYIYIYIYIYLALLC